MGAFKCTPLATEPGALVHSRRLARLKTRAASLAEVIRIQGAGSWPLGKPDRLHVKSKPIAVIFIQTCLEQTEEGRQIQPIRPALAVAGGANQTHDVAIFDQCI